MLTQNERLLAPLVQPQRIAFAQIDAIMRHAERLGDFGLGVCRANPLGEPPPIRRAIAPLRQHDPGRPKERRGAWLTTSRRLVEPEHQASPHFKIRSTSPS